MRYQDLVVWQRAMQLVEIIYRVTSRLPTAERYGLCAQMRRSARSIPANIAEGYGRGRTGDYRRHLSFANGSLFELETDLDLAVRLDLLRGHDVEQARAIAAEVGRLLTALRRSLSRCSGVGGPDA
jgi:four helix bundle protein